jgi:hypothetical protein
MGLNWVAKLTHLAPSWVKGSLEVLTNMWSYTLKLIDKKSKHVNLGHENGFGSTKLHSLGWLVKGVEKSVINMIWLLFNVFDWPIIMIGPSGLLLIIPCLCIILVSILSVRLQKKLKNELQCEKTFLQCHIFDAVGDVHNNITKLPIPL